MPYTPLLKNKTNFHCPPFTPGHGLDSTDSNWQPVRHKFALIGPTSQFHVTPCPENGNPAPRSSVFAIAIEIERSTEAQNLYTQDGPTSPLNTALLGCGVNGECGFGKLHMDGYMHMNLNVFLDSFLSTVTAVTLPTTKRHICVVQIYSAFPE